MTILFMLAGGVIFGLLVFLMYRRRVKRDEMLRRLKDKVIACPECGAHLPAAAVWQRTGLRGDFCKCSKCGNVSIWDFDIDPPKLKHK
jgi:transcription elongation factor Elf1